MRGFAILFAFVLAATALSGCKAWDFSDPFHPGHGNRNTLDGCEPCVRCNSCCECNDGCAPACGRGQPTGPGY